jgi:hypothetical protein
MTDTCSRSCMPRCSIASLVQFTRMWCEFDLVRRGGSGSRLSASSARMTLLLDLGPHREHVLPLDPSLDECFTGLGKVRRYSDFIMGGLSVSGLLLLSCR